MQKCRLIITGIEVQMASFACRTVAGLILYITFQSTHWSGTRPELCI